LKKKGEKNENFKRAVKTCVHLSPFNGYCTFMNVAPSTKSTIFLKLLCQTTFYQRV
jgi:hypothetical protein